MDYFNFLDQKGGFYYEVNILDVCFIFLVYSPSNFPDFTEMG